MLTACPASNSAQASPLASLLKPRDLAAPTADNRNSHLRQHPPNYNGLQRIQHRPLAPLSLSVLLAPMFRCCICISQGGLAHEGFHARCLLIRKDAPPPVQLAWESAVERGREHLRHQKPACCCCQGCQLLGASLASPPEHLGGHPMGPTACLHIRLCSLWLGEGRRGSGTTDTQADVYAKGDPDRSAAVL